MNNSEVNSAQNERYYSIKFIGMVKEDDINGGVLNLQSLQFEASWEKAIAINDRKLITDIFQVSSKKGEVSIQLVPIWEAMNYKGEVLITVLIHNFTDTPLTFRHQKFTYQENETVVAEHIFTIPQVVIKPRNSMPWTFIFPIESLLLKKIRGNGKLECKLND